MSIPAKVIKHLEKLKIKYKPVKHRTVYTAYDAAATMRAKLGEIAKTLHIVADKKHILAVVPASHMLDLGKLKILLKAKRAEIAQEKYMIKVFGSKKGSVVPFVGLYKDVGVWVDRGFSRAKRVLIGGGTFQDSLEMKVKDFLRAAGGILANFAVKKPAAKKVKGKKDRVK